MSAAALAGAHRNFAAAENAVTSLAPRRCEPIAGHREVYDKLYALYRQLYDGFGRLDTSIDTSRLMQALIEIKYAGRFERVAGGSLRLAALGPTAVSERH